MGKVCLGVSDALKGLRKAFRKAMHLPVGFTDF